MDRPVPWRRLDVAHRVLCLIGPVSAAAMWGTARFLIPWAEARPWVTALFGRPCLLRSVTGVPCPFCGGTRSVVAAAGGAWLEALLLNPFGAVLMAIAPPIGLWLALCAATGRDLGFSATGGFLRRRVNGYVVLGSIAALWAFRVVTDCCLGVG